MMGDRPGSLDVLRESLGMARAMTHEPPAEARSALTSALIADVRGGAPSQADVIQGAEKLTPEEALSRALQGTLDAVAIVLRVSPGELDGFRRCLYHIADVIADVTARAVKEGGFLGIGGKPISAGEAAMFAELADSLGIVPQP